MSEHVVFMTGTGNETTIEGVGKLLYGPFSGGVITGWAVSQRGAGANMSVDVAVGQSIIADLAAVYAYYPYSTATKNVTVTAADLSNPRRDIVVAYVDLAAQGASNNQGALKFKAVAGTPAASPSDPSDSDIQTSVGASNPWIKLARLAVGTGVTSIVNANITDLRTFSTFAFVNITNSNISATAAIATSKIAADAGLTSGSLQDGKIAYRQGGTSGNASWATAGTTNTDVSAKRTVEVLGVIAVVANPTAVTFPVTFSQVPHVMQSMGVAVSANAFVVQAEAATTTTASFRCVSDSGSAVTTEVVNWVAKGQTA